MDKLLFSKESIILNIGDIKLDDTEKTFGKINTPKATINGTEYQPLDYEVKLLLNGEHIICSKINCENDTLYYIYGANNNPYSPSILAIGFYKNSQYVFICEGFSCAHREINEIYSRTIVTVDNLEKPTNFNETLLFYMGRAYPSLKQEQIENFYYWQEHLKRFESSFSKQNLNVLRRRKLR